MDTADIISCFFGAIEAVIQPAFLLKKFSRKPNIPLLILFSALIFLCVVIPLPLPVGLIISTASVILCCRFAFGASRCESLLYGILSAEIMWLCYGIFDSLLSIIFKGLLNVLDPRFGGIIFLVAGNALSLAEYWIMFAAVHKIIKNERAELQGVMIILQPLLLIFIVEIYIVKVLYKMGDTSSPIRGDIELLLVQMLGAASLFCTLVAYKKCANNFRMREKIRLYDEQRHYSKLYISEIKSYYNTAKSLRHDFKNHILIINELLYKEQYKKARDYISELDQIGNRSELKFHTGCLIMDIIFTEKLSEIVDKVEIKCTVLPEIDETDICTIFANAVDNAICAISKLPDNDKYISISTAKRGNLLFIKIENSYDGKPFETGTGLENIIRTTKKYGGTVKITTRENIFTLKMILCNSQH